MEKFAADSSHNQIFSASKPESKHIVEEKDECNNNKVAPQRSSHSSTKVVTNSSSQASIGSDVLQAVDEGFADYIRRNKSFQRVDFTPDPIPRFFITGMSGPSYTKDPSAFIPQQLNQSTSTNWKDKQENAQSSSLVEEKSSKSISAKDLASDDSNHSDVRKVKRPKSSSSFTKRSVSSDKRHAGKVGENDPCSPNTSARTENNNTAAGLSTFFKSTNDDQIVELKQPKKSPSISSSIRSATSNGSNLESDMQATAKKSQNQTGIIPKETKQDCSQGSLAEIESFHRRIVGDISMLDSPCDLDNTNEKKTFSGSVVERERVSAENGNDEGTDVGAKIKIWGPDSEETDAGISSQHKKPQSSKEVTGFSTPPNSFLPSTSREVALDGNEDKKNYNVLKAASSKNEDMLSYWDWEESDSTCPNERLSKLVNKYINTVEEEWQQRRECWLQKNKHNPNSKRKKNCVYAYETFKEYMADNNSSKRIGLRFPYNLPDVRNNRNPILQEDDIVPIQYSSSTKNLSNPKRAQSMPSKITKLIGVGGDGVARSSKKANQSVNNNGNDGEQLLTTSISNGMDAKANNNLRIAPETAELVDQTAAVAEDKVVLDTVKEEEEPVVPEPMNLTPFMDQCGDIFNELKTIKSKTVLPEEQQATAQKIEKVVGILVKKYVDFLETEWIRRRDACMKEVNLDENSVYKSFGTFRDGLLNGQIEMQVPFSLPHVHVSKKIMLASLTDDIQKLEDNTNFKLGDSISVDAEGSSVPVAETKLPTNNNNDNKTVNIDDRRKEKKGPKENVGKILVSPKKPRAELQKKKGGNSTMVNSRVNNNKKRK